MDEGLVKLTRRNFFRAAFTLGAGAFATAALTSAAVAQPQLKDVIERRAPVNLDNLPEIVVKDSRAGYIFDSGEELNHLELLKRKYPLMTREPELISAQGVLVVKPEPDMRYAQALAQIAKDSIDDFVRFLDIMPSPIPLFKFPQSERDISYKAGYGLVMYFVSNLDHRVEAKYRITVSQREDRIKENVEETIATNKKFAGTHGVGFNSMHVGNEYQVTFQDRPIFINTGTTPVYLLETPAIEMLHKLVRPYTLRNIGRERPTLGANYTVNDINKLVSKHENLEEKFVHALSILWLREYNKRRNIGFTEQELNQRFAEYEQVETYRGANRLSNYIAQIGVKRAFEMYLSNPNELFRGAGSK